MRWSSPASPHQDVVTVKPSQLIVTRATENGVITLGCVHSIIAGSSLDHVIAAQATDQVVATKTLDVIHPRDAEDDVFNPLVGVCPSARSTVTRSPLHIRGLASSPPASTPGAATVALTRSIAAENTILRPVRCWAADPLLNVGFPRIVLPSMCSCHRSPDVTPHPSRGRLRAGWGFRRLPPAPPLPGGLEAASDRLVVGQPGLELLRHQAAVQHDRLTVHNGAPS